ncbi:hypothetical protein LguiB_001275 [Lonicera macranthoides]
MEKIIPDSNNNAAKAMISALRTKLVLASIHARTKKKGLISIGIPSLGRGHQPFHFEAPRSPFPTKKRAITQQCSREETSTRDD